jgi:hypothetical protein
MKRVILFGALAAAGLALWATPSRAAEVPCQPTQAGESPCQTTPPCAPLEAPCPS